MLAKRFKDYSDEEKKQYLKIYTFKENQSKAALKEHRSVPIYFNKNKFGGETFKT